MGLGYGRVLANCFMSLIVLATIVFLSKPSANADPPANNKFLQLPFAESGMKITTGWYYDRDDPFDELTGCAVTTGIDGKRHCGIDYSNGRASFPVKAAAGGLACKAEQRDAVGKYIANGLYVWIRHDELQSNGQPFWTWYAHLSTVVPKIPFCEKKESAIGVSVSKGETIGDSGNTGVGSGIHLHFAVSLAYVKQRVDPYDIAGALLRNGVTPYASYYPGGAPSDQPFSGCGPNYLWTECPPSVPPPTASACTNIYTSANPAAIPPGYGAAFNVLSSQRELVVQAVCNDSGVEITVGSGSSAQYIYRDGWAYRRGTWQKIQFTGSDLRYSNWYVGWAFSPLVPTTADLEENNFFVGYICTNVNGVWKCGCQDENCVGRYWQLQNIKRQ